MKNKKFLKAIAVLTLGGTAALSLAIAGCAHKHTYSTGDDWGKDETGHWHYATCDDLKKGDEEYAIDFAQHNYGDDDVCDVCGYKKAPEPDDGDDETEYTITLNVGNGALGTGESTTLKTVGGKISGLLPEPTSSAAHWQFDNWYDAETGGNPIDERTKVFESDTTLYARYIRDNGVWNADGSEFVAALSRNMGEQSGVQYWLGNNVSIALEKGDEIVLYFGGELVTFNINATYASSCIENADDTSTKVTSVTVSEDASFKIHLWNNSDDSGESWSCQFLGTASSIESTSTIPEGCEEIKITGTNGTATVYLVVNGVAVNSENGTNYQIHGWQTGNDNVFGGWNDNPTIEEEVTVDCDLLGDLTLMFHWNGGQSGNVSNVKVGGTYVVKINTLSGSTVSVKKYDPDAPADEDEEEVKKPVVNGYYLAGAGFTGAAYAVKVDFYIDPDDGLTVTLPVGAKVELIKCTSELGEADWGYGQYASAQGGDAYIKFTNGKGTVLAGGEYTITVDVSGDNPVFVFIPGQDVQPSEVERDTHYYIKGDAVDAGWNAPATEAYELKETAAGSGVYTMTIELTADSFMFYSKEVNVDDPTDVIEGDKYIKSEQLGEGKEFFSSTSGDIVAKAAGTYTFTFTASTNKLDVTFVPAGGGEVDPPTPVEVVLYIRGAGKSPALDGWNATTALTKNNNTYTITLDLYTNDVFKFADAAYTVQYGADKVDAAEYFGNSSGNISCLANGNYTFTIDHAAGTVTVVRNGDIENPVEEVIVHYYIKGAAVAEVGWNAPATEAYELKETGSGTGVYTMSIELSAGEFMFYSKNEGVDTGNITNGTAEIKADKIGEGRDYVEGTTGNITAKAAGTYTFTFTASTNKLDVAFSPAEGGDAQK